MKKIKKLVIDIKWLPAAMLNKMVMFVRGIESGKNLKCYGSLFIRGTGKIVIGNDVRINSCRETNPIGGDTKTILFAKGNGNILIGNRVGISNTAIVAVKEVVIEDDVMIGAGCKIYDNDFHAIKFEQRVNGSEEHIRSNPVRIKKGAFIGAHSIILKGTVIGEKSIVGAGSVVTGNIPDGEIWAGNPARFIRKIENEQDERKKKDAGSLVQ